MCSVVCHMFFAVPSFKVEMVLLKNHEKIRWASNGHYLHPNSYQSHTTGDEFLEGRGRGRGMIYRPYSWIPETSRCDTKRHQ